MHQVIWQVLVVDCLAEQELDCHVIIDGRGDFPQDLKWLLLVYFEFLDHVVICLSQFISDIGSEYILMEPDFDFTGVVGSELGGREFANGPHGFVVVFE